MKSATYRSATGGLYEQYHSHLYWFLELGAVICTAKVWTPSISYICHLVFLSSNVQIVLMFLEAEFFQCFQEH
jgi:hypothetical protein